MAVSPWAEKGEEAGLLNFRATQGDEPGRISPLQGEAFIKALLSGDAGAFRQFADALSRQDEDAQRLVDAHFRAPLVRYCCSFRFPSLEVAWIDGVRHVQAGHRRILYQDAEEIVQEVLLRVLTRFRSEQAATWRQFCSFVRKTATNACLDWNRRQEAHRGEEPLLLRFMRQYAPGRSYREVLAIVDLLPEPLAGLWDLRMREMWTVAEIAAELGCSKATVNRMLAQMKETFQRLARAGGGRGEQGDA